MEQRCYQPGLSRVPTLLCIECPYNVVPLLLDNYGKENRSRRSLSVSVSWALVPEMPSSWLMRNGVHGFQYAHCCGSYREVTVLVIV